MLTQLNITLYHEVLGRININKLTLSGSEIVTAAMRDRKRPLSPSSGCNLEVDAIIPALKRSVKRC